MTTTAKENRSERAWRLECEQSHLRLRKYLGRLVSKNTKPGGRADCGGGAAVTFRMFCILMRIDDAMIGTPDYMGLSGWWHCEYKFDLREATPKERKKAHDAILAAGLPLGGVSDEHAQIVAWATNNGKRASERMGGKWSPYRGPRPAKRKAAR